MENWTKIIQNVYKTQTKSKIIKITQNLDKIQKCFDKVQTKFKQNLDKIRHNFNK